MSVLRVPPYRRTVEKDEELGRAGVVEENDRSAGHLGAGAARWRHSAAGGFGLRAILIAAFAAMVSVARADDLDVLVGRTASAEDKGHAYERLCQADFSTFGAKLATIYGAAVAEQRKGLTPVSGMGPMTAQPWSEVRLSEEDRTIYTLAYLWDHKLRTAKTRGEYMNPMLDIIENPSVGEGRRMAITQLNSLFSNYVYFWDSSMPPMEEMLARLERRAFDEKEPNDFRRWVVQLLFEYGDPNRYLDLVIELTSRLQTALEQSEEFRFSTPASHTDKLSPENRKKYLRFSFQLLEKIDDGRTGRGYFLASHLRHFLRIQPLKRAGVPFAPAIEAGRDAFFQGTVDNARQWWQDHQAEY